MSDKTEVMVRTPKSLQSDIVQLENKLETVKAEYASMERMKDLLQQEMDKKRQDYDSYIASRERQLRNDIDRLISDQAILNGQREDFKSALEKHVKNEEELVKAKAEFDGKKLKFEGERKLVNDFVQAVRRAYNVLPE